MSKRLKIGTTLVGDSEPCFIIAEVGVNHNGDVEIARQLVDAAVKCKVNAVKFQTFKTENLTTRMAGMAEYQMENVKEHDTQFDMIKKLELSYDSFLELKKYCDKKGILFLSTAHTQDAADFLDPIVPAFKISSGDLTNLPFLENIAKKKKPIILSTGMANLGEIEDAISAIKSTGNANIIIMHCITNYPTKIVNVNLKAMQTLRDAFKIPVGFSDHTMGIEVSIAAVALGACVIEKHFTLDRNLPGPDHKASLEPQELASLVRAIRNVESALGSGIKTATDEEEKIKVIARKSIVTNIDIEKGTTITPDMITIKRPGSGISPKHWSSIIGKKAKTDIPADEVLSWSMLE